MALKLLQQLPKHLGQMGICRYVSICSNPTLLFRQQPAEILCVACLCTSSTRCIHNHGCRKVTFEEPRRGLTTIVCEQSMVGSSSVSLHKDSFPRVCLTQMHQPTTGDQEAFYEQLNNCTSSCQVFRLLHSVEVMTDTMAAASLHRVADLEKDVNCLKDPSVLEKDIIRALCQQLEEDSEQLTDSGVISALLACTRLYLDPWSTLMVRLVSESQKRVDQGQLGVLLLCDLGNSLLSLEGPGSILLEQVISQIQARDPAQWTVAELLAVYKLIEAGAGFDGRYCDLFKAMHTHTLYVTSRMNPSTVSGVLGALTNLQQTGAKPLVKALCKEAARHVPHFTDEELTVVLGALIHFCHSDHQFVDAMEKYVPSMTFTSDPETVTKVMQFFGRRNILSPVVFDAVAESFMYRASDYTPSQVTRQIMAFGKLGYLPPNAAVVFRTLETILDTRFSQFQPRALLNLLHSCILVERFPVNFVSKVFSSYFLQQLQGQGSGMNRYVLAQLTQLHMTMMLEYPFYRVPRLLRQYRVKNFRMPGQSLETPVDEYYYELVKIGLVNLLGCPSYFGSRVLTPYCYTLDVEIKLDEDRQVLPASRDEGVFKRLALCIDGHNRFTFKKRQLLGKEATKQRHLRLLGYEVIQLPFYELKRQKKSSIEEYLRQKIFPHILS